MNIEIIYFLSIFSYFLFTEKKIQTENNINNEIMIYFLASGDIEHTLTNKFIEQILLANFG